MTDSVPASLSALGICLEEYEYPYPVRFLPLSGRRRVTGHWAGGPPAG
jgi:hypothetical protein